MKAENYTSRDLAELGRLSAHYQLMTDVLRDLIKQLISYDSPDFTFTFNIGKQTIVVIEITKDDAEFCIGNFMAWHGHYSRKLREYTRLYNNLTSQVV